MIIRYGRHGDRVETKTDLDCGITEYREQYYTIQSIVLLSGTFAYRNLQTVMLK